MRIAKNEPARVLVVASAGGHWEQILRLRAAFANTEALYVTTLVGLAEREEIPAHRLVQDCNQSEPGKAIVCALQIIWIVLRFRPHRVVTTGSLPGLLAIVAGRFVGARTLWIDSLANAEELSSSGAFAKRIVHVHVSQWAHVAANSNTSFEGRVL